MNLGGLLRRIQQYLIHVLKEMTKILNGHLPLTLLSTPANHSQICSNYFMTF